jgi:hypothetical protein
MHESGLINRHASHAYSRRQLTDSTEEASYMPNEVALSLAGEVVKKVPKVNKQVENEPVLTKVTN